MKTLTTLRDEVGIDHYWCMVDVGAQTDQQIERTMRLVAEDVLPSVRDS